jgi:hypothetical protein
VALFVTMGEKGNRTQSMNEKTAKAKRRRTPRKQNLRRPWNFVGS